MLHHLESKSYLYIAKNDIIISGLANGPAPNFQNMVTRTYVTLIDFKNAVAFGNNYLVLKLPLMSIINSK